MLAWIRYERGLKLTRLLKASMVFFVILLAAMLMFSRRDARPVDDYLTIGFPLTFYSVLQNMGCLGPLLPNGTCCVDLCPPKFSFSSLIVDVGLIYAAAFILASGYVYIW
jgi:hypothetical protein